jgi:pimeloyl-ACP methyl ester carboxylesterase
VNGWRLNRTLKTRQGTVAWDRVGTGPPTVFIHGTPWSSFVWRQIAIAVSAHRSVYIYDLPGFGASEKYAGQDVSLASQAQVLAELLDAWRLEAPAVVAHDIGGAIALRAALLGARRFGSLALLDPVALSPWGSPFYRLVRDHASVFEALPPRIHAAVAEAYIRGALIRELAPDVLDALVAPWRAPEGQAALYRQIAQGDERHTDEFRPHLGGLDARVLLLWGEEDPWIPVQRATELADLLPRVELRTISGAGHLIQEDAPGIVLRHLLGFLSAPAA